MKKVTLSYLIKGNAAVTIINEWLADDFQIVMPCDVVLANGSLACDGVAFNLISIFTGQAAVNRCPVNFLEHKNNLRFLFGVIHQIRKTKASASQYEENTSKPLDHQGCGSVRIFFLT